VSAPVVEHVLPPGDDVAVYPVIAEPPLLVCANHATVACAFPAVALTWRGALGAPIGADWPEANEAADEPSEFFATTVNVYFVPFVNPLTVQVSAPVVEHVFPPGDDVTVYPVIGSPPVFVGAAQVTLAEPAPATTAVMVGRPGVVGSDG